MNPQPRSHRAAHRRPKRRDGAARGRIALAVGAVTMAVGTGAGIAFDAPGGSPSRSSTDTLSSDNDASPFSAQRPPADETPPASPSSASAAPSASEGAEARKRPSAKAARPSSTPPRRSAPAPTKAPRQQSAKPPQSTPQGPASATDEVIRLANQERARAGCAPLTENPRLTAAAERYSDVMAASGVMSHTGPDGSTMTTRVETEGYAWSTLGENIAQGQPNAAAVMDAWMNSPGHRANILNCSFKEIGVGVHEGDGGPWWTQNFGTRR